MTKETKGDHRVLLHSRGDLGGFTPANPGDLAYGLRGRTEHFVVSFAASLGSAGPSLADAVLANCEADFNQLQSWFGSIHVGGLPFAVFLKPGSSGASHISCRGTQLFCDTFTGTDMLLISSLVPALPASPQTA